MRAQGIKYSSRSALQSACGELKDEVYRQMFRLEASRPGADISLAVALLRAWVAAASGREMLGVRSWLRKISPICIFMLESVNETKGDDRKPSS